MKRKQSLVAVALGSALLGLGVEAVAAAQTFDDLATDDYGPSLAQDELVFQSENGTSLSVTDAASDGLGIAHSPAKKLSTFGSEPRSASQRTGFTVRFAAPAKSVDFWLSGTFHDTTIEALDARDNVLATTLEAYPQPEPLAPDGTAWDAYYDRQLRRVQVAAAGIAKLRIRPSEYDGFSIDDFCYEPDADPSAPLIEVLYPGYPFAVAVADLGSHTGALRGAFDREGVFYYPGRIQGQSADVIHRRLPTGSIEMFARVNAAYRLSALNFDPEGDMILVLRALGCPGSGTPPLALVRVTGFEGAPSNEPVATPTISPPGGTFTASVAVSLATATPGADIRYTLDGSAPTNLSALYTGPVPVISSATLKARGFKSGHPDSAVASAAFVIQTPPPQPQTTVIAAAATWIRTRGWMVVEGTTELTYWTGGQWIEYAADFGAGGTFTLSATGTNFNNPSAPGLPAGFAFNLTVQVDGVNAGNLQLPGSTTAYRTGSLPISVPGGVHNVRLTWTNDMWNSGVYDANLQLKEIAFSPGVRAIDRATLPRLMCAGASHTQGYGDESVFGYRDHLAARLGRGTHSFVGSYRNPDSDFIFDVEHEGLSGDRTDQLKVRLAAVLPALMPAPNPAGSKILILVGTNDVLQDVPVETAVANAAEIINLVHAHDPAIGIYVSLLVPSTWADTDAKLAAFNAAWAARVAELRQTIGNLYLADMSAAFKANPNWATEYFFDPIHPNDAGYQVMAAEWDRVIRLQP